MSSKIKTSGGIVVKENKILFIRKNNRWDLPKGKVSKKGKLLSVAINESIEETGLKKKNLKLNPKSTLLLMDLIVVSIVFYLIYFSLQVLLLTK